MVSSLGKCLRIRNLLFLLRWHKRRSALPTSGIEPEPALGMIKPMAVPKGFKSWQDYFNRHIAQCENCAPYFQGEGQMSAEGERTDLVDVPHEIGIPDRISKRVLSNAECDGCHTRVVEMIDVWVRPTLEVEYLSRFQRARQRYRPRLQKFEKLLTRHPFLGAPIPWGGR